MWFLFALGTAFFQAVKDVFIKRSNGRSNGRAGGSAGAHGANGAGAAAAVPGPSGLALCWAFTWATSALLWLGVAATGAPEIGPDFWPALAASTVFNCVALVLYFQALSRSDLSLTAPMLTFTPLFMLLTSPLILGEYPRPLGLTGIVCIVAGSYVLSLGAGGAPGGPNGRRRGLLAPLRALLADHGPRRMLAVAVIWSVSANFDKIGVPASGPIFWPAALFTSVGLVLAPVALLHEGAALGRLRTHGAAVLAMGAAEAVSVVLQMHALTLALAPYVIAVKRLSAVFGVAFGALLLGERNLGRRLAGALLMVAGVACITLWG